MPHVAACPDGALRRCQRELLELRLALGSLRAALDPYAAATGDLCGATGALLANGVHVRTRPPSRGLRPPQPATKRRLAEVECILATVVGCPPPRTLGLALPLAAARAQAASGAR